MLIYESLSSASCEWMRQGLQQALSLLCNLGVWLFRAGSLFRRVILLQLKENVRSLGVSFCRYLRQYSRVWKQQPLRFDRKGEISRHLEMNALSCKPSLQAPWLSAIQSILCKLLRCSCTHYIKIKGMRYEGWGMRGEPKDGAKPPTYLFSSLIPHPLFHSHPSSPIPHPSDNRQTAA